MVKDLHVPILFLRWRFRAYAEMSISQRSWARFRRREMEMEIAGD
jgi:hypothetical protein